MKSKKKKRTTAEDAGSSEARRQYRGYLAWNDHPASGRYDFLLALCDAPGPNSAVRAVMESLEVAVNEGRYSLPLGVDESALGPGPLWLAVAVRPSGSVGAYLRLPGKQPFGVGSAPASEGFSRSA